ncbi:mobile mystery protein B [Sphingomonas sp. HT-1]|uniref:mobile mystery protein B n=1 Tax=unclassified Sphingomonas TaxID=196159 RepID=UPI0002D66527|nr:MULTISPECIES: mobile mystery protein B [unclassified Sphingomonas]KTF70728.1 cell filamentation protein Fic [Sphingomonas sp. WG]
MTDPLYAGEDEANTPLEAEEREQLIPTYITTRAELNEAEQVNITRASLWLRRARNVDVLEDAFLRDLHKRMFGEVWKWAGQYRRTPRNIGIDAYRIPMAVRELVQDARYWVDNGTYPPDEIAIRFSHRLVSIHPFPNGNGRHSRLVADLLAMELGQPRFTWGRANLVAPGETRRAYVTALRAADGGEIEPLLAFARS